MQCIPGIPGAFRGRTFEFPSSKYNFIIILNLFRQISAPSQIPNPFLRYDRFRAVRLISQYIFIRPSKFQGINFNVFNNFFNYLKNINEYVISRSVPRIPQNSPEFPLASFPNLIICKSKKFLLK